MLLKSDYQKEDDETLDIRLMALNCLTKTAVRSQNPIVHASFEHAGCYVFIREAKDDTPGQIYVGQTRYFDARFNGYERVEDYSDGMVILIHQRSKPGFDEADIQHLEYLLIDHFKDECFGSNFQLENKQSGTASVGHTTVHTAMEGVRDVVIHHLKSTFGLSLYSTGKNLSRLELIQAESSPPKKQKRYLLKIERDPVSKLFRVKEGSLAVDHDNVAYWHHKQIHRRLKKLDLLGPTLHWDGRGEKSNHRRLQRNWIAMNISEVVGALTNSNDPSKIPWRNNQNEAIDYGKVKADWTR